MPSENPDEQLVADHDRRLLTIDSLLAITAPTPAVGEVWLGNGRSIGLAAVRAIDEQSLEAAWGKLERFVLKPFWDGEPDGLDELLTRWAAHVHADPRSGADDSQAAIAWPSRDLDAARIFVKHGLAPATTLAVRLAGRPTPGARAEGVRVRRARPGDVETILALGEEELAYEEGISVLTARPGYRDHARGPLGQTLAGQDPWAWVAESAVGAIGALTLTRPDESAWIGDQTSVRPAAYLPLLCVTAAHRASGAGSALVAAAHEQLDCAGVGATLLHYGTFNPLSVPFWSRMGYRPLWTYWEAFPARHVR